MNLKTTYKVIAHLNSKVVSEQQGRNEKIIIIITVPPNRGSRVQDCLSFFLLFGISTLLHTDTAYVFLMISYSNPTT